MVNSKWIHYGFQAIKVMQIKSLQMVWRALNEKLYLVVSVHNQPFYFIYLKNFSLEELTKICQVLVRTEQF